MIPKKMPFTTAAGAVILIAAAAFLVNCARSKGECDPECELGQTCCNGLCADLSTDSANCGSCGNSCGSGTCQDGTCLDLCGGIECPAGQSCCDDECTDTDSNDAHCGSCGNACPSGTMCEYGRCIESDCDPPDCGGDPMRCCSGRCVNTETDMEHCGFCGHACDPEEADSCSGGVCQCNSAPSCHTAQKCCAGVGCRNISSDINNCGDCGVVCESGLTCNDGECNCGGVTCAEGYKCCTGTCKDIRYDATNCGDCNHRCGFNAPACVDGTCVCGSDAACMTCTFAYCSSLEPPGPYDGCEICCPLMTGGCVVNSDEHCGGCGVACTTGTRCEPVMGPWTCTFECVPTYTDASTDGDA